MTRRAPTHKRVSEGAADRYHHARPALEKAVRDLCIRRLENSGLRWSEWEARTARRAEALWKRGRLQEGKGRRLDKRAMLAYELDRKLWFGVRDKAGQQLRGNGPSPGELACIWLLLSGVEPLSAARLAHGVSAEDCLDAETEAMKKCVARHGQTVKAKAIWFPANQAVVVGGKYVGTEPADDADAVVHVFAVQDENGEVLRHEHKRGKPGSVPTAHTVRTKNGKVERYEPVKGGDGKPLLGGLKRAKLRRRGLKRS